MKDTPSMRQYQTIKKQYPDAVLFFRMGDFYETFEDDARISARVLDITLTSRDKGEDKTPMAGIPYHALMSYLPKMIQAGYKVALCEQIGDPKTTKGIVQREIVKIFTPGTAVESELQDPRQNICLASVFFSTKAKRGHIGIAIVDLTAGKFQIYETKDPQKIAEIMQTLQPAEIILPESLMDVIHGQAGESFAPVVRSIEHIPVSYVPLFDFQDGQHYLEEHFHVANLKGFVREDVGESIHAGGALLKYIEQTQKHNVLTIEKIEELSFEQAMYLDPSTIHNLELVSSSAKGKRTTLVDILDHTKTAMGARLIRYSLLYPLLSKTDIQERLDSVDFLMHENLESLQDILHHIADIERINARMSFLSASPRDFLSLRQSLEAYLSLRATISSQSPSYIHSLISSEALCQKSEDIIARIAKYISEEATVLVTGGNIITSGVSAELDELKDLLKHGKSWIREFQEKEIARTGINSLKIRYNKVFGYYIEISNAHKSKVPVDYIRKQTLVNAERYITEELKEKEDMILHAQDRIIALENTIFAGFREDMLAYLLPLKHIASHIAFFDMLVSFAYSAKLYGYAKPVLSDDHILKPIRISAGRHPVIEQNMDGLPYIPNDVYLDCTDYQVMLITGPNMSGKSSILRMTAIICLMTQIGSFVPAESAEISIVDRIFSRVGARDNIASGESTFMVEMNETANILHNATDNSLIILDEIGRGTSTYDGVSIAYAVVEYIHDHIGAKTMFATHYHELTEMEYRYKRVKNFNVLVREDRDTIVFLRKLQKGGTDKSYGIHVAKIAGVPKDVLKKAEVVLKQYDTLKENMKKAEIPPLLSFIGDTASQEEITIPQASQKILDMLKGIDINTMTPLESMEFLVTLLKALDDD